MEDEAYFLRHKCLAQVTAWSNCTQPGNELELVQRRDDDREHGENLKCDLQVAVLLPRLAQRHKGALLFWGLQNQSGTNSAALRTNTRCMPIFCCF